jgi:AraC-like DNA-binding protein
MVTQMSGKLPSLDEIAAEFAISPRTLSNEFKAEYGQPLHAFMMDLRLNQAHAAIEANSVPLKALAQRLGYTHTHHFLTAFRRKFGYPPSVLRKK